MITPKQELFVTKQLLKNKRVDRNLCLRNFISRLGAIIYLLKKDGWIFKAGYDESKNYVYHLVAKPKEWK